jgi:RNA polymerase sigma factor (sigma-70 family)
MTQAAARQDADVSLVARCMDGDEAAWEALVRRHGPVVWTIARRAGLAEADAADVYQTVWRIAVESLPRLRDTERFPAWIAQTARFQTARAVRTICATRRALGRIDPRDADDAAAEPGIEAIERRRTVTDAMGRIGDRCAHLLRALYFDDSAPDYAEIARRLGMRIGSIGPTRARCLARLRDALGRNGHDHIA